MLSSELGSRARREDRTDEVGHLCPCAANAIAGWLTRAGGKFQSRDVAVGRVRTTGLTATLHPGQNEPDMLRSERLEHKATASAALPPRSGRSPNEIIRQPRPSLAFFGPATMPIDGAGCAHVRNSVRCTVARLHVRGGRSGRVSLRDFHGRSSCSEKLRRLDEAFSALSVPWLHKSSRAPTIVSTDGERLRCNARIPSRTFLSSTPPHSLRTTALPTNHTGASHLIL